MTSSMLRLSNLQRLASYRTISDIDAMVFCSLLADLGYFYTGHDSDIMCEGCGLTVQIHKEWPITKTRLSHENGCVFERLLTRCKDESLGVISPSLHGGIEHDASGGFDLGYPDATASNYIFQSTVSVIEPTKRADFVMPMSTSELSNSSYVKVTSLARKEPTSSNLLAPTTEIQQYDTAQQSEKDENYIRNVSPASSSSSSSGYGSDITTEDIGCLNEITRSTDHYFQSPGHSVGSARKYVNKPIQEVKHIDFPDLFLSEPLRLNNLKDFRFGRECDKNPGHFAYFNITSLKSEQIPTQFRCPEMLDLLKVMSNLTVRVVVSKTSSQRRNRNQHKVRVGTGFVIEHSNEIKEYPQDGEKSKLDYIKKLIASGKKKNVALVFVQTSRHLVYNDEEAQNTTVEFFYNSPDSKDIVNLEGKYLLTNTTSGDSQCLLVCQCTDSKFIQRINLLQQEFFAIAERLPLKSKNRMSKKLFMVHHPHGGPKVLSYGDYVTVKYKYESGVDEHQPHLTKLTGNIQVGPDVSEYRKTLFYAADTCPGSCGAPILTFCPRQQGTNGDVTFKLDIWMHNGVETSHKLGAAVLKECLLEDFQKPRPNDQMLHPGEDSDDDDENNLGKQKANSPVYKVTSTPSHPEYTSYQSRLDSFKNWTFGHIMKDEYLATAGFYYTGESDCVRCFQCGLGLRTWKQGDDVINEHEKYRPTCPYLKSLPKGQEDNITGAMANLGPTENSNENLEVKVLKAENSIMKKQLTCKVCFKSDIKDVFLPCGELYACSECSKLLTQCPSCGKQILATVTVYLT